VSLHRAYFTLVQMKRFFSLSHHKMV
jgi:hypothetical protein